jgi:very-short-patch-repair endonuclease
MRIAVEIEGAVYTQGRHTRGAGYLKDCEKYNEAQMLGWTVLRYSTSQTGAMMRDIERMVKERGL